MRSPLCLLRVTFLVAGLAFATASRAQPVFDWITPSSTSPLLFTNPDNWNAPGGFTAPPPTDGSAILRITTYGPNITLPDGTLDFSRLYVQNPYPGGNVRFSSAAGSSVSFTNGFQPTSYSNDSYLFFDDNVTVRLTADQYWSPRSVSFGGSVGGPGLLSLSPSGFSYGDLTGFVDFGGANDFDGGLNVSSMYVDLLHPQALAGDGILHFSNSYLTPHVDLTVDATMAFNGFVHFLSFTEDVGDLVFNGPVILRGTTRLKGNSSPSSTPIFFNGLITQDEDYGTSTLIIESGRYVVAGDNSDDAFSGGTHVEGGQLIFASPESVPASGLLSSHAEGYIGAAFSADVQTGFLDRTDPTDFKGTLGFDTPEGLPMTIIGALDLTGIDEEFAGLGSSTSARITGPISVGYEGYQFGGGGGTLFVDSNLDELYVGLSLHDPSGIAPLRLVLRGSNSFGEDIHIGRGMLIIDGPSALPASSGIHFESGPGYIGLTELSSLTFADLLGQIETLTSDSIIGFDGSDPETPRTVSGPIDLSRGGTLEGDHALGTSSHVILTGPITPGSHDQTLFVNAVRDGTLRIAGALDDAVADLVIGSEATNLGTGTVALAAANAHTGDTALLSGNLLIAHDAALGSGRLVADGDYSRTIRLLAEGDRTLGNDVRVEYELHVGSPDSTSNLTLTGDIRPNAPYSSTLIYEGAGDLTLTGSVTQMSVDSEGTAATGTLRFASQNHNVFVSVDRGELEISGGNALFAGIDTHTDSITTLGEGVLVRLGGTGLGEYSPSAHFSGTVTGAGGFDLRSEYTSLTLLVANSFSGGISATDANIKVGHDLSLGSGDLNILRGSFYDDVRLSGLAPGLSLANAIDLQGNLQVNGSAAGSEYALALTGDISGSGNIDFVGDGTFTLAGGNTFTGELRLRNGQLNLTADTAAGRSTLILGESGAASVYATSSAPVLHGLNSEYEATLLQLAMNAVAHLEFETDSEFRGTIAGEGAALEKRGGGVFRFAGSLEADGGIEVASGSMIFGSAESLGDLAGGTANAIRVGPDGYVGLSADDVTVAQFLSAFNPAATFGAIGFDGLEDLYYGYEPAMINEAIDLSGFATNVRLGTATEAIFGPAAVITPAGGANAPYRFGNGGGLLFVESNLTGDRDLVGESHLDTPLLVVFSGTNTFTGDISVVNTGFVFAAGALPASANLTLGAHGYLSSVNYGLAPGAFAQRITASDPSGILGFDRVDDSDYGPPRIIAGPLDVSNFTAATLPFLGTASALDIRGSIILPDDATTLRLAAYQSGRLTVSTPLSGSLAVQIGDPNNPATHGDRSESEDSEVTLRGANTHTGGTTLYAGRLSVTGTAAESALGSGPLVVEPHSFGAAYADLRPELTAAAAKTQVTNGIQLNTDLIIGGEYGRTLTLSGTIVGSGGLIIDTSGTVALTGANTYTGGTFLDYGTLALGHAAALGSGGLQFGQNAYVNLHIANDALTLANPLTLSSDASITLTGGGLTLTGPLAIPTGHTTVSSSSDIFLEGPLSGEGQLSFSGGARIWLSDASAFFGQLYASGSALIFSDLAALESLNGTSTLLSYSNYIGLAEVTPDLNGTIISLFDSSFNGVIGFDTRPGDPVNVFAAPIDLSELGYFVHLGTSTRAVLSGEITPSEDRYRFGSQRGGQLTVSSNLADASIDEARALTLNANSDAAFILRLTGNNTYSNETRVDRGGLVFAGPSSLSPATSFSLASEDVYLGLESAAIPFNDLLERISTTQERLMLGIDTPEGEPTRTLTSPDLSRFVAASADFGLGTSSAAIIDGTIVLPPSQSLYRFFGYGGGHLTVASTLDGPTREVFIGQPYTVATVADTGLGLPSVTLSGANTYGGGTFANGGRLVVAHTSALGTGTLTFTSFSYEAEHELRFAVPSLANAIHLQADLTLTSSVPAATLTGPISGSYVSLRQSGDFDLTLASANSISYSTFIVDGGALHFDATQAEGFHSSLHFAEAGGDAHFNETTHRLVGLSNATAAATIHLAAGTTLELNAVEPRSYSGAITGDGGIKKTGSDTLVLSGPNDYAGGTLITDGLLFATHAGALGTGAITLDGGLLGLASGVSVANTFTFGSGGGRLGGNGTYTGDVTLGANAGLAPGSSIGAMTFAGDLEWAGGAFFDFEVEDALGLRGSGYDTVYVGGALNLTATEGNPFIINLLTINDGFGPTLAFDNTLAYTWTLASAATITGFDVNAFEIDYSGFDVDLLDEARFDIFSTGDTLAISFTPVPEPSTYALLGVGLGLVGLNAWRRRRRA